MSDASHWSEVFKDVGTSAAAFAAVAGAVIALLQYFSFKFTTYRDKAAATRKSLETVVASLASTNEVDRLAGAVLLRKFFDPTSEVSTKGTPYATDAVTVIAAILRGQPAGHFQKLLADGLAFAPSLEGADLQRTNLQNAYLSLHGERRLDLRGADFFRADLAGASLKGANASGAYFYQARMTDAVLKKADLTEADFREADLFGVIFDDATLTGAKFDGARNVPVALAPYIKNNRWSGPKVFKPPTANAEAVAAPTVIYVSKPGCLDAHQEKIVALICGWLKSQGLRTSTLERSDYPATSVLSELRRRMSGCAGAIVFGFAEMRISDGLWRSGTADEAKIVGRAWSTPWNHVEAGMAAMINLPLMLAAEPEVTNGVFEPSVAEHNVFRMALPPDPLSPALKSWLAAVGTRAISA